MDDPQNESIVRRYHLAWNQLADAEIQVHKAHALHNDAAEEAARQGRVVATEQLRGTLTDLITWAVLEMGLLRESVRAIQIEVQGLVVEIRARDARIEVLEGREREERAIGEDYIER